jgi:NADH:ubiquinone oxidoreductase subunit F (NADH-binding)
MTSLAPMAPALAPPPGTPRLLGPRSDLRSHLGRFGPMPAAGRGLIDLAAAAGLTGRGGAAFATARKMAAVAAGGGGRVVVANGTEGEPLSAKDKTLLTRAPHLVLDGLDLAAAAVGARRRILCVERGRRDVVQAVQAALSERGDRRVELLLTPARFLSGQETALVDLIDGGPGRPTLDLPYERGVAGHPTLVDNVETLAQLALVARFGPDWYRSEGTPAEPGTALVTLAGAVTGAGVYEVPYGTPLAQLIRPSAGSRPRGVLVGGYFGRWLAPASAGVATFERASLGRWNAAPGAGVIAVIDESTCALAELTRVAAWYAASSAGQCGACTWGLRDLAGATAALGRGNPRRPLADIKRWLPMIAGRGACKLPDGAVGFLESGIEVFAGEIAEHREGRCRRPDRGLLPTPAPEAWR